MIPRPVLRLRSTRGGGPMSTNPAPVGTPVGAHGGIHKRGVAQSGWLEARSFENLVRFYASELRAIMAGRPAAEFFGTNKRAALIRRGVFSFSRRRSVGSRLRVSSRTKAVLRRLRLV